MNYTSRGEKYKGDRHLSFKLKIGSDECCTNIGPTNYLSALGGFFGYGHSCQSSGFIWICWWIGGIAAGDRWRENRGRFIWRVVFDSTFRAINLQSGNVEKLYIYSITRWHQRLYQGGGMIELVYKKDKTRNHSSDVHIDNQCTNS